MRVSPGGPAQGGQGAKPKPGDKIPPGLAKKKSEELPDGNPWKAVLKAKEEEEAKQQQGQQRS